MAASAGLFSVLIASFLFFLAPLTSASTRPPHFPTWVTDPRSLHLPSEPQDADDDAVTGTRWAVLVAGSQGYSNYRHQADVCHAYQILHKGGIKDENIVVFMYDDIADNPSNPRPGVIINHPEGEDVYAGVPKDYTGVHVNTHNLYAVLLGDKSNLTGGSGKVVDSKPGDRIFIYYTDHGGPGILGMPNSPRVYADDFISVLKKKHASGTYKEMVVYVEACESGSIFEGLMPSDLDIYVTTASGAKENSYATYCPGGSRPPPKEYTTCLGDLYSVAWMEDTERHNLKKETFKMQYENVKLRTSNANKFTEGSHVTEYGTKGIRAEKLYLYLGFDPANSNATAANGLDGGARRLDMEVNQRDADLLALWHRYKLAADESPEKMAMLREITETVSHRLHLDDSISLIGKLLFGAHKGPSFLHSVRPAGQPLVDDWSCLKSMVRVFEHHCGSLTQYGMKHMRAFANICNSGVTRDAMEEVAATACGGYKTRFLGPDVNGYSA